MTDDRERNIPMVRLLDPSGEGVWIATDQISAIALATQGMQADEDAKPLPVSKLLVAQGTVIEIQGTPDEIMQYLAGGVEDDSATLNVDENPTT